jgi:GNAT superfamily N-acetyltransferase
MNGFNGIPMQEVIHQVELNLLETWSGFGRGPGCTLHEEKDATWFETPIPVLPYNSVIKFHVEENADQRIDALVNRYKERNVPQLWILHPSSKPNDLAERLQRRGLHEIEVVPGMARLLDNLPEPPPIPDGLEIREALSEQELKEVYDLAAWRWGVPDEYRPLLYKIINTFNPGGSGSNTRFWLAWKDGKAVSKIGLYNGSGSAGIYAVVTLPEVRGLGIASILMDVAMKAAKEMGQELCVLDSSPPAENLYKRLGFTTVSHFTLYSSIEALI